MELQEKIYAALTASLKVPVVKYLNEYKGDYPVAVFKEISNVPAIFGDNVELLRAITYQISIGTADDNYAESEIAAEKAMRKLGFKRVETTENLDEVFWRNIKFVIYLEVKNV